MPHPNKTKNKNRTSLSRLSIPLLLCLSSPLTRTVPAKEKKKHERHASTNILRKQKNGKAKTELSKNQKTPFKTTKNNATIKTKRHANKRRSSKPTQQTGRTQTKNNKKQAAPPDHSLKPQAAPTWPLGNSKISKPEGSMVWVVLAAAYVYTTTPVPASTRFRSPFTNRTTHPPSGKVSYEQRAFGGGNSGGGWGRRKFYRRQHQRKGRSSFTNRSTHPPVGGGGWGRG